MLNVGIFYYDHFANHEIIVACHELRKQNIMSLGIAKGVCESTEKQKLLVEHSLREIDPKYIDAVLVPGGITEGIGDKGLLFEFLREAHRNGSCIAAICGGTFLLAESGILDTRKCTGHFIALEKTMAEFALFRNAQVVDEDVVVDGTIITARGKAYVEFGLAVAKTLGLLQNAQDYDEEYAWLKNRTYYRARDEFSPH